MMASPARPAPYAKGNIDMALRFENFARTAVSFVGAAAVTALLIANSISLGPVA
jgi:hypothetical protein